MRKNYFFIAAILVFVLAFFLRFYRLDLNLPNLYSDETGHYFLRNLILGKSDSLKTFLYNKIYYGTFSFTWIFGLTPLGVRFASALYGSLSSLTILLFAYALKKNKTVALLSGLLTAVLPGNFMISRLGHTHVVLVVLLSTLHLYFFVSAKKTRDYLISLLFLGLTLLYYPSIVAVAPPVTILVLYYLFKTLPTNQKTTAVVVLLGLSAFLIPFILERFQITNPRGRALDLAIWRDVNTPYDIDKYRALSWNSPPTIFSFGLPPEQLANKLVYNKVVANLTVFGKNYFSFFSPDWLFLRGDSILRHSTGQVGAFLPFLLPFMLYGAYKFFKTHDSKARAAFLIWIIISPVPAAITKDGAGYLLRVVTLLPFLTYFCALGLAESFSLVKNKWRFPYAIILALVGLYSTYYFFYGYFHVYPSLSARSYEFGFKELSDFHVESRGKKLLIVWDGYYHYQDFLFWQRIPFTAYQEMKITPIVIGETTIWQTLPGLFFAAPKQTEDIAEFLKKNDLDYLVLPDRFFVKYSDDLLKLTKDKVKEIPYPDKTTALTIYSLK